MRGEFSGAVTTKPRVEQCRPARHGALGAAGADECGEQHHQGIWAPSNL